MKKSRYTFKIMNGEITVSAFSYDEALILAQAEAINCGYDYKLVSRYAETVKI